MLKHFSKKSGDANARERWLRQRKLQFPKGVPLGYFSHWLNAVPAAQCQRGGLTSHTNAKKKSLSIYAKALRDKKSGNNLLSHWLNAVPAAQCQRGD